jgi:hypothetical protein
MKYAKIYHPKALQNKPQLAFLVWKYTIWQLWAHVFKLLESEFKGQFLISPLREKFDPLG